MTANVSLAHFDNQGQAHMVDVAGKASTRRIAVAQGCIVMNQATQSVILAGNAKKGDVLGIVQVPGMGPPKKPATSSPCATRWR